MYFCDVTKHLNQHFPILTYLNVILKTNTVSPYLSALDFCNSPVWNIEFDELNFLFDGVVRHWWSSRRLTRNTDHTSFLLSHIIYQAYLFWIPAFLYPKEKVQKMPPIFFPKCKQISLTAESIFFSLSANWKIVRNQRNQ